MHMWMANLTEAALSTALLWERDISLTTDVTLPTPLGTLLVKDDREGATNIKFVQANAEDLSRWDDGAFD